MHMRQVRAREILQHSLLKHIRGQIHPNVEVDVWFYVLLAIREQVPREHTRNQLDKEIKEKINEI